MKGHAKAEAVDNFLQEKEKWTENFKKIGNCDYIKIQLFLSVFSETLEKIFFHYYENHYAECFNQFNFYSDQVSSNKLIKYINETFTSFLDARADNDFYIKIIDGFERKGHPIEKYKEIIDGKQCYSLDKIFGEGIQFIDSKANIGIQLADILASTIRQMALGQRDVKIFDVIRKNCAFFRADWLPVKVTFFGDEPLLKNSETINFLQKKQKNAAAKSIGKSQHKAVMRKTSNC